MASIKPHGKQWRAFVFMKGVRESKVHPTKYEASAWAVNLEREIIAGIYGIVSSKSFAQLLEKYAEEVSLGKRTGVKEQKRIAVLLTQPIAKVLLADLNETHVAEWRNQRIAKVSGSTVNREWNILSNAMKVAQDEWKWVNSNPFHKVERPKMNPARTRIASEAEIEGLIHSAGYSKEIAPSTVIARVMAMALFAFETAMRCKEMTRLKWNMVHLEQRYVEVSHDSKTGARHVPLSREAMRIIEQMREVTGQGETVFNLNESQVDTHFRKIRSKALIQDLTFHDCKHYACTKLAQKVHVLDLARIVGTKDLKTLQIYYNKSASDIAASLD
jgi:integrase